MEKLEEMIVPCLMDWFGQNARKLPWRDRPVPYYVWVSEIMLQQTRIGAAKGYFERFIRELPDIGALSQVSEEKLLKLWEGLGYYSRARNLKKAAILVMQEHGGKLPEEKKELLKLPGIGEYTAGAIASIAYGKKAAAVDGNVLRVIMRLRGSLEDISKPAIKRELASALEKAMPEDRPGILNQALMELGETVCLPNGRPLCEKCPAAHLCQASRQGTWRQIPVKAQKKPRRIEEKTVLVIEGKDGIFVRKRPGKGLLAGMWEFPCLCGKRPYKEVETLLCSGGFQIKQLERLRDAKHIFSYIEWHMAGYYANVAGTKPGGREPAGRLAEGKAGYGPNTGKEMGEWEAFKDCIPVAREQLEQGYPMPSAFEAYRAKIKNVDF